MACDGVEVERGTGGGEDGVFSCLWRGTCVGRDTDEVGVVLARREEADNTAGDAACTLCLKAKVRTEHIVYVIHNAFLRHSTRAAHALLSRLKDEFDRPPESVLER